MDFSYINLQIESWTIFDVSKRIWVIKLNEENSLRCLTLENIPIRTLTVPEVIEALTDKWLSCYA